jgi:transposase-like protein
MLGFKTYETAKKTISGIEVMHMIHKGQIEEIRCTQSEMRFISEIMGKES